MKFKEFLLSEEFGLGDIGTKIDQVFKNSKFGNIVGGFVSNQSSFLPSVNLAKDTLEIPQVEKTGRVTVLLKNRNPIYIRLSDGTEASFTYDEYKRIEGEPSLGKTMTIIFQRHPNDLTQSYSKVDKCIVKD